MCQYFTIHPQGIRVHFGLQRYNFFFVWHSVAATNLLFVLII